MDDLPADLARARDSDTVRGELNALLERHGETLIGVSARAIKQRLGLKSLYARRLVAWVSRYGTAPIPGLGESLPPRVVPNRSAAVQPTVRAKAPIETPTARPAPRDLPPISRWDVAPAAPAAPPPIAAPGFERVSIPEDATAAVDIDALIARQEAAYERKRARAATYGPRQIKMDPGPFAIVHFGDPHVDDDGCDWPLLRRTVEVVARTPGMYGGNVGDTVNNWIGRLTHLYAEQQATEDDGWELARWLMRSVPWLYVVLGNHDLFGAGRRILDGLIDGARIGLMAPDEVKLELLVPEGESVRMHARHDFPGHSMWNSLHGLARAGKLDGWADLYVAGHRHTWAASRAEDPDGRVRWAVRARGYKRFDSYARSKGFHEQQHGESVTTVHDPTHRHPAERVQVYLDPEEAAEVLTWKRRRWGGGR